MKIIILLKNKLIIFMMMNNYQNLYVKFQKNSLKETN